MKDLLEQFHQWRPTKVLGTRIGRKTVTAFLVASLVPLLILGVLLQRRTSDSLQHAATRQVESVRSLKTNQVQSYFADLHDKLSTFAENEMTVTAMKDLGTAFPKVREENAVTAKTLEGYRTEVRDYYNRSFESEFKNRNAGASSVVPNNVAVLDDDSIAMQYLYIQKNPNPIGAKDQLNQADDTSDYSKLHGRIHPIVRNYAKKFGLHNIFLVDAATGHVVYSVNKDVDFATSLKSGPYSNSGLGDAFRNAVQAATPGAVVMTDYSNYLPSYNEPASFLGSPIFDNGKLIGVACFQFPNDRLNALMADRTGLGETGETYLVGADGLFRTESRFASDLGVASAILNPKVKVSTDAVKSAIAGESATKLINDYHGVKALTAWSPVKVHTSPLGVGNDLNWPLIAEIDLKEVQIPLNQAYQFTALFVICSTILVFAASLFFARKITRQAEEVTSMLSQIGMGMFEARAQVVSNDELGDVATSINAMCDNTLSLIQSREERDVIQKSIAKLQAEVRQLASGDLTHEVEVTEDLTGPVAESVNDMITQLRGIVSNIQSVTGEVSTAAGQIRSTTEYLSTGSEAQSVQITQTSNAVSVMAASIQAVAENTKQSSEVAAKARANAASGSKAVQEMISGMERIRGQVQDSAKRIKRLGEASQEIGEIVQLISDIADRTSILALNASIQAAMAGEAGQGFAVVAEEVDRLADRSNEATKRIGTLIRSVQSETAEAIAAMERSTKEVVDGSLLASQAGTALDEIDAVSGELADLIAEVTQATRQQARGAEAISKSMTEISSVTHQTAAGTKQAAESVTVLAQMADDLNFSVRAFKLPAITA
ncbi:MAG: methyl-accepting chemotaxis sensory transducer [Planctomycetaceae bacterium]|nr:methyl-accepting chemotaxis sensory transducer [Planctomycetaceae bacterium]